MLARAALLTATGLAVAATTAAGAVWRAPVQVSGSGTRYPWSRPDLSVAPDGTAALAWQRSGTARGRDLVEIAQRPSAGGRFGPPVIADFVTDHFAGPVVAAASGNRALLLWARQGITSGEPRALGYGLAGLPSSPAVFPPAERITSLHVALGPGRRELLWRGGAAGPLTAVTRAGAAWGAPADLAPAATASAFAAAADGRTVTAWVAGGHLLAAAGSTGTPVDLGPAEGTPAVAVAPGGRALVAWCTAGAVDVGEWSGAAWSVAQRVGGGASADDCALAPAAAIAEDGTAVAAWRARVAGRLEVRAARRLAGGDWQAARRLGRGPRNVGAPVAVLGPDGAALVAWSHPRGTFGSLIASRTAPAGTWGPRADVGVRGFRAVMPDLGTDAAGRITLAFLAVPNGSYSRGLRVMTATRVSRLR
ncbi:MAG: hypothetical protein IT200_08590 [Thermoleophilia bacterium]|nr:hypothetical protein [Thermoleophilia bacterium]